MPTSSIDENFSDVILVHFFSRSKLEAFSDLQKDKLDIYFLHVCRSMRRNLYIKLINLLYNSGSTHIGSCLSCFDILTEALLFQMKKEDRIILSKGHAAPGLYVLLNYLKKIPDSDLDNYLKDNTRLTAHPSPNSFNDILGFHSGSLGHGLSISCGIAEGMIYGAKLKKQKRIPKIYCLISDGECNEGQVWEAAQYAGKRKLKNLIVLVDKNGIQAFDKTVNVLGDPTTKEKWEVFGFDVFEADGHSTKKIKNVFKKANVSKNKKPKVIIFNTIKGKGISFMENKIEWHYNQLNKEQYEKALEEIKKL